jgi:TonB-dependent starch-binding outer membrane protein SusC
MLMKDKQNFRGIIYSITKQCKSMHLTALFNVCQRPFNGAQGDRRETKKLLLAMKLTAIILLTASVMASAKGKSQGVSISMKDAPLEKVFKEIKRQTGYSFMYTGTMLKEAKKVSIDVKNYSLEQALDVCLANQPFSYTIIDKTIVLKPREATPNHTGVYPEPLSGSTPPPIDIKGRIVNENGEPLEGISVKIKGTNTGTSTNANGEFTLNNVDEDAVMVFTGVNIESFETRVAGRKEFSLNAKTKVESMNEVVINKGYYTEKQRVSTSNVFTVKAREIEKQPVNNPLLALVGRVPGMTIEQQTGYANSGIVVRIQGTNSLQSGLEPLYVIDGVPYLSKPLQTVGSAANILGGISGGLGSPIGGNPLSLINPNDIESIDILKDADATAIYGSRGANGVVLITTKRGKAGQTRVNATFRSGWGKIPGRLELLNTEQYLAMRKEAYVNDGLPIPNRSSTPNNSNYDLTVWDSTRYMDWQDALFGGTSAYTDAQASLSGGSANTQFLISSAYHKETTVFPGDYSDQKGSVQFNISHANNNQKFKIQASGIYVIDNNQIPNTDFVALATKLAPNAPALYNADGTLNWQQVTVGSGLVSTWTNPLAILENKYTNKATNLVANLQLSYQLLRQLKISSRFGYNNQQYDDIFISPLVAVRPELRSTTNRSSSFGNANNNGWIIEPQLTYDLAIGKSKFSALAGTSFQQSTTKSQPLFASGFSSDLLLKNMSAAPNVTANAATYTLYKYNAIFGRLNYNFKDRYILNATARRDGSSRFGNANLLNNFWSIAGGWVFTNESWVASNLKFLNFGKLRASYGTSGNDQIGDYQFMNLYNPVTSQIGVAYQGITALAPNRHTNPYLQWEETNKFQIGLDLGLLNNRINFGLNYYRNRSSNLLVQQSLSGITGFTGIVNNFEGVLENTGWEFSLQASIIQKRAFNWTANFNLTVPVHNAQLVSFPDLANSIHANRYAIGKSIYDERVYHSVGVDPATGLYQFVNASGNKTSSPTTADLISYRNGTQRLFGGLQNSISYKGFELDFTFQGTKKNAYLYIGQSPGLFNGTSNKGNQPIEILDRWQKIGDIKPIQKTSSALTNNALVNAYASFYAVSDGRFVDASFIRLTNLSFSWQLPAAWQRAAHLKDTKLFMQGQNLFSITGYKGLDPSSGSGTSDVILPPFRIITLGASLTF